jgi:hypothetical protein
MTLIDYLIFALFSAALLVLVSRPWRPAREAAHG